MMTKNDAVRPLLSVTAIAEYIGHSSCQRRAKLTLTQNEISRKLPFAGRVFAPLDVALKQSGAAREQAWEQSLLEQGLHSINAPVSPTPKAGKPKKTRLIWKEFAERLTLLLTGQQTFAREVEIVGNLGAFRVAGRIDFILLVWREEQPYLRLAECKASRQDRMHHIVQVALYKMLLELLLAESPLTIGGKLLGPQHIECVVARVDEATGENQAILALPPLDLTTETADLTRLLAANGPLARIQAAELDTLPFQLAPKCHDCTFSYHCMTESARQRRLELLGMEPALVTALRSIGIATIDGLADLEPDSPTANVLRADPQFASHLPWLIQYARARRKTLPGGDRDRKGYEVETLFGAGDGQLPPHEIEGQRLVRVYLGVDYDHVAARVGCLSAHVTNSAGKIKTPFRKRNARPEPDPKLCEMLEVGEEAVRGDLTGVNVVEILPTLWTGNDEQDTEIERDLLQRFFARLTAAIIEVANETVAPVHFYVWRRAELTPLVEACRRCGSDLLWHLAQLLGCRENLEQMLYSTLQDEVYSRYALGWTSRTLCAATSLTWFGNQYHWVRNVGSVSADLSKVFFRDQHDCLTGLHFTPDGKWATPKQIREESVERHTFEVRARFFDGLPPAYLYAHLNALPPEDALGLDPHDRAALRQYRKDTRPGMLEAYLVARVHALRWIEERVKKKNTGLYKPALYLPDLTRFHLGPYTPGRAAVDYLRLEHQTAYTDWLSRLLVPPLYRVPQGDTLPVRDVHPISKHDLLATIDLTGYGLGRETVKRQCGLGEGAFVRLAPCSADPSRKQTVKQFLSAGATCRITRLNWETGEIILHVIPGDGDDYKLYSRVFKEESGYNHATLDPSISDFVAGWVEWRLESRRGVHVCHWLDPQHPQITPQHPLAAEQKQQYAWLVAALGLNTGQQEAALHGLEARVQTLQGPPGTGKSFCTAAAILLRILAQCERGNVVLVSAATHTALNELLDDLHMALPRFTAQAQALGMTLPNVCLSKVHTSNLETSDPEGILSFEYQHSHRVIAQNSAAGVLVVAGTPAALLKMTKHLNGRKPCRELPEGFTTPLLVVDEASMMPAPHFLALATLVQESGSLLLAGDHRQLTPIQAHSWEQEDRPPVQTYLPQRSAFQFVRDLKEQVADDHALLCSGLTQTYRLTPNVRRLLTALYAQDGIALTGSRAAPMECLASEPAGIWGQVWGAGADIVLLVHDESASRRSNAVEAGIIRQLVTAACLPDGSVGCLTPHRAQRSHLTDVLAEARAVVTVIDTVERLQGGERQIIIVSATASEPTTIAGSAEFLLDIHRALVALSRSQERLIVVVASSLLDHIPAEREHYLAARLWKSLRAVCPIYAGEMMEAGQTVRLYLPSMVVL